MTTDTGIYNSRDELLRAIWDFQFDGLSQSQIMQMVGVNEDLYKPVRGEAAVSFDPTAEQLRRVLSRAP